MRSRQRTGGQRHIAVDERLRSSLSENGKELRALNTQLAKMRQPQRQLQPAIALVLAIALLAAGMFALGPELTSFFTAQQTESFVHSVGENFSESRSYELELAREGELRSLAASGTLHGSGYATVYLEAGGVRYLVANLTAEVAGVAGITGFAVADANNASAVSEGNITVAEAVANATEEDTAATNATPENATEPTTEKTITTVLTYNSGTPFDVDNDGVESSRGAIDFTVAGSALSWAANASNLCTLWQTESEQSVQTACYGDDTCCALSELAPSAPAWDTPFTTFVGSNGAGLDNTIRAQVMFADISFALEDLHSEIVTGSIDELPARFVPVLSTDFSSECDETCILALNESSYLLIVEVHNATLELASVSYSVAYEIGVPPSVQILSPQARAYSNNTVWLNFSAEENATLWYVHNGVNRSIAGNMQIVAANGTNTLTLYAQDSAGNVGSDSVIFTVAPDDETLDITPVLRGKGQYKRTDAAAFEFEYLSDAEAEKHGRAVAGGKAARNDQWKEAGEEMNLTVLRNGKASGLSVQIEEVRGGKFALRVPEHRSIVPGRYTLELNVTVNGTTYETTQDFLWGVLAMNVNKSVYLDGEDAFIGIGVLDDEGRIVCDADVTLQVSSPDSSTTLSTAAGDLQVSPECKYLGVTQLPDYYGTYSFGSAGTYEFNLTAVTANGERSIVENISVVDRVAFDVARTGPSRVYPVVPYAMNITITPSRGYNGLVREFVPAGFEITPQAGMTVVEAGDAKIVSWLVDLRNSETTTLGYEFDAPDVSPELYVLGPLEIGQWEEARQWQIANDAPEAGTVANETSGRNYLESCSGESCLRTYYSGDVAYDNGTAFAAIDDTVVSASLSIAGRSYEYAVETGVYKAYFRETSSDVNSRPVALQNGNYTLTLSPQDFITFEPHKATVNGRIGNRVASDALIAGESVTYPGQYTKVGASGDFADLEYTYLNDVLKEELVIADQAFLWSRFESQVELADFESANVVFPTIVRAYKSEDLDANTLGVVYGDSKASFKAFGLAANGEVTLTERIDFTDEYNNTAFFVPVLYARDSAGTEIVLNKTLSMTDFGNLRVDVLVPMSWLNDSARTYPVYIDPSVRKPNPRVNVSGKGVQNVTLNISELGISTAALRNANVAEQATALLGITDVKGSGRERLLAVTSLNAESAELTLTARGTRLFECAEWNATTDTCESGWSSVGSITPGEEYSVNVGQGSAYSETGLVTINTHKATYVAGDVANISIGVIDEQGATICDANVTLVVVDPSGTGTRYENTDITRSGICTSDSIAYLADYFTIYETAGAGTYWMNVSVNMTGSEGQHLSPSMNSTFEAASSIDFDVSRTSATRIYPPVAYWMNITVDANTAYSGNVTDAVPQSFEISEGAYTLRNESNMTLVVWDVAWSAGEQYNLSYLYDAPDVSPELFQVGPLRIGSTIEARQWQIASDAPARVQFDSLTISDSEQGGQAAATITGTCINNPCDNVDIFLSYTDGVGGACSGATNFGTSCATTSFAGLGGHTLDSGTCTFDSVVDNTTIRIDCTTGATFSITYNYQGCTVSSYEVETESAFSMSAQVCQAPITVTTPDTTRPNLSILSPASNALLQGSVLINASANDTSGIASSSATWYTPTGAVTSAITMTRGTGSSTSGTWNATYDTLGVADGSYNISVAATDSAAGANTNISNVSVTVNNYGPNASVVVPVNGSSFIYEPILINVSANDTLVSNVTVQLANETGGTGISNAILTSGSSAQGYWTVTLDSADYANGEYNITVNATDELGKQSVSNASAITINNVDIIAPNASILTAAGNYSGLLVINASANDTAGVELVNYSILQPGLVVAGPVIMTLGTGSSTSGTWNATLDTATLADGEYNISVNVTDTSNNQNITQNVSIVADNTAPNASAIVPANGTVAESSTILINASVNDTVSDVVNVTYQFVRPGAAGDVLYATRGSGSATNGYWNFSIDTANVGNGHFNITANATDFVGNQYLVNISEVTIDDASISSCSALFTEGKTYTLSADVTSSSNCMNITASDITLDCNGNTITYATDSAGYGIYAQNVNGTTIRNCLIESPADINYSHGIFITGNKTDLRDNTLNVTGDQTSAIQLSGQDVNVSGTEINSSTQSGSGAAENTENIRAIAYHGVSYGNVTDNIIRVMTSVGYTAGINVTRSQNILIARTSIISNSTGGTKNLKPINIILSNDTTVTENNLTTYADSSFNGVGGGVRIVSSTRTNVTFNIVNATGDSGSNNALEIIGSNSTRIANNTVYAGLLSDGSGDTAAYLHTQTNDTLVENNTLHISTNSLGYAAHIEGRNNVLRYNTISAYGNSNRYIQIEQDSPDSKIIENFLEGGGAGAAFGSQQGISVSARRLEIANNTLHIESEAGQGISVAYNADSDPTNINVTGNLISINGSSATAMSLSSGTGIRASANTINVNVSGTGINVGSYSANVTENDITVRGDSSSMGINIISTNGAFVTNSTINVTGNGIVMTTSTNNTIHTNTIASGGSGIYLETSQNSTVARNNIRNNGTFSASVYLFNGADKNLIQDNNITATGTSWSSGITSETSLNNTMMGNIIDVTETVATNNHGIDFLNSKDSNVTRNIIRSGDNTAIHIQGSDNNTIYDNILNSTGDYVITLSALSVNNFSIAPITGLNIIGGSTIGGNFYDNSTEGSGQRYSLNCTDADEDGLCDSAFVLNGTNLTDYYPLAAAAGAPAEPGPTQAPNTTITFPADGSTVLSTNFSLNYTHNETETDSITFYIYLDGEFQRTELTNTTMNLTDGQYSINVSTFNSSHFGPNATASITVDNKTAPIVHNVTNGTITLAAGSTTDFAVQFNVTDADGVADINDSTAMVNVTYNGVTRSNNSGNCDVLSDDDQNKRYTCLVTFFYYDNATTLWEINASVADNFSNAGYNDSTRGGAGNNVTVNELSSFALVNSSLHSEPSTGEQNLAMRFVLNNTGNTDFSVLNVTPYNLNASLTDIFHLSGNFSINATQSASGFGRGILNATPTNFTDSNNEQGATLPHLSTVNDLLANRTLYIYVDVPSQLQAGTVYNSSRAWELWAE